MAPLQPLTASAPRYDETLNRDGSSIAHWQSLLNHIDSLSQVQRGARQQEIMRQLRANGLTYEPEADEADQHRRNRTLDLIPLLFDTGVWDTLTQALDQRARLKQAIYQDIYGPQRLLKERLIPPSMLYAHKGYLRDLVAPDNSNTPATAQPLIFHTCDIGRSATGEWQALDDFCQYPSGVGYALENRLVLKRVLPRRYKQYRVSRIVSYFRQLQSNVLAESGKNGRCVLLSYPSSHPHYFEFAWLARYLSYPLVEPADLTVRDHIVYLKTITGLQPVDVILRLIDDTEIDPMIIGSKHNHGVPGLVEAARRGGVRILNPMGTGVLDNPALNTCMPQLCEALLQEPLQLQSQPTLWLGDPEQFDSAVAQRHQLHFRHVDALAHSTVLSDLSATQQDAFLADVKMNPAAYIAQQPVLLSSAPSLPQAEVINAPVALRVYQILSGARYETMPGALALLGAQSIDARRRLQGIDASKDVWILSSEPVPADTLVKSPLESVAHAIVNEDLPSRIAESEFWLGRNSERVEAAVRLLRRILQSLLDEDRSSAEVLATPAMRGLLRSVTAATGTYPGFTGRGGKKRLARPERELKSLLQDVRRSGTLANALQQWQFSASAVSDRLSSEQLRVFNRINELQTGLAALSLPKDFCEDAIALDQIVEVLDELLLVASANTGLEHENLTHSDVWIFKMLGRRIERAHQISVTVSAVLAVHRDNQRLLEYLLRVFDSVMTYRARYRSGLDNRLVLQLLLLDEINPRSLAYQFKGIQDLIGELPGRRNVSHTDPLNRLAVAGLSRVRLADPDQLLKEDRDARQSLQKFLRVLQDLSASMTNAITSQYFTHTELRHQLGRNSSVAAANASANTKSMDDTPDSSGSGQ